ncbi:putative phosphosugar-binding protein [Prauserella shujinwangii]|uniref:Putative phosphosugar-binding protein n=1 Tax=Prauserella shujinwangii TaxID=1453103 RepID=A0A2T0LNE0_9PSEU|nr:SIS domain-containing protein [Prauserella shujinwangii]PRX44705.1 putative phosphosugar-binding protein [Prauserella shujinwangii]
MRDAVRALLDDIDNRRDTITEAADLMLTAVDGGGLVHAAGAGHSLAMVCETFYRAGGLAAVRPLWDPEILPLAGARRSSVAEREPGRGRAVVAAAAPTPSDVVVVFSTSGRNPYPVEVAQEALARKVPVIAVTSLPASAAASDRTGTRLADHATVVLDTGVPPGDVAHPADEPRTSAVSTILCSYLWSLLLAELTDLATARGTKLPLWTSSNVPGGDEHNAELMARYGDRIPELTGPPA